MTDELRNALDALRDLERLLRGNQDRIEERERLREYVRREHVPFLHDRMRTFDEYLARAHPERFKEYTRLTPLQFMELYERIAPRLIHPLNHASPITAQQRLFTFLRCVGHGIPFSALSQELHCGRTTIGEIVSEVGRAISRVMYQEAFPPITREHLEEVAIRTQRRFDYPRAVGFLDGKHIEIKKPPHSGGTYFNYLRTHSIILLAVVDFDNLIMTFDVGAPGSVGDAGFFGQSNIKRFFERNEHIFPPTRRLGTVGPVQYHILIDSGFGQGYRYVRPYSGSTPLTPSQRRFNRKHSRARAKVEATFGMLSRRFLILSKTIELRPNRAMELVTSLLVLHNWIRRRELGREEPRPAANPEEPRLVVAARRGQDAAKIARERIRRNYDRMYNPTQPH